MKDRELKTAFMNSSSRSALLRAVKYFGAPLYPCLLGAGAVVLAGVPHQAHALSLYNGESYGNNLEINLTTELEYSIFERVNAPSAILTSPSNPVGNEGDIDFRHGIVSNELEALPVLDIRDGDYGAHFSGEFYLNTVYLQQNQNNQPETLNEFSVGRNTDFTSATRNVEGENARLLDAFVSAKHSFSNGQQLSLKVGRQTLMWGQSLFFAGDSIAGGMAPVDIISAQNTPNAEAQQIFLPVGQVVLTYQPFAGTGITLQGYYQSEWQHDNFQAVGAYFNSFDVLDKGGQRLIFVPGSGGSFLNGVYAFRGKDLSPPPGNGQFGVSVQAPVGNFDLGLYALRFDSKQPVLYLNQSAPTPTPFGTSAGTYRVVYPRDIAIYGASFSTNIGPANVAGEISGRTHQPLLSGSGISIATASNTGTNVNGNPLYAVGDTIQGQLSTIYVSPGIPLDPGGVSFAGEIELDHVVTVTQNRKALTPGRQGTAGALQFVVTPTYDNVLPSVDVTFPIGVSYNYLGRSEMDGTINHGTGTFNIGVSATYNTIWTAGITYFDYLGKADPVLNGDADRGYVEFNIARTF
jgi:hypothetical protein